MKVVVIHVRPRGLALQVRYVIFSFLDFPDQCGGFSHQDEKDPSKAGLLRHIFLGELMFAFCRRAMDLWHLMLFGPRMDPTAEASHHA